MTNSKTIYLKDYQPAPFQVPKLDLTFHLHETYTRVQAEMTIERAPGAKAQPLVLFGSKTQTLKTLRLNDQTLSTQDYTLTQDTLTISKVPDTFTLTLETEIKPHENTQLSGLYRSGDLFCTQCEPEGFRRIIYSLDRSDVLSRFTTTLYADRTRYPVLLSNGNCVESGLCDNGRHFAKWVDPHPKPTYLFALVAGALMSVCDHFVTQSGRLVHLALFTEPKHLDQTLHALAALKKAMIWDEKTYGREYDLDIYMIVAVSDFNSGAMENKGLNIFNSRYILARPETATDSDFRHIDDVIAHEYFHNWSGNRVTCRNWFQLSLKEGLTVFREQHFSRENSKSPVALIDNVRLLRTKQFAEDASPLAHPVRPDAYQQINNFYTMTVYEKGAEVIRMLETLLGQATFQKGLDHYFKTYDGQAVSIEEFVKSHEIVSKRDLSQFMLWYQQAGTPEVIVQEQYDPQAKTYTLHLTQSCPPTPNQPTKKPFHIPIAVGLLDPTGQAIQDTQVLELKQTEQSFVFENISVHPIPSLLRDFSAPIQLKADFLESKLSFILEHDPNDFNRFEAAQSILSHTILKQTPLDPQLLKVFEKILCHGDLSKELISEIFNLPSLERLVLSCEKANVQALFQARTTLKQCFAKNFQAHFKDLYLKNHLPGRYEYTQSAIANRRIKNRCLDYLMSLETPTDELLSLGLEQFYKADNLTDSMGALVPLSHLDCPQRDAALTHFYEKFEHEPLVINKWLSVQAMSHLPNTLETVKNLLQHKAFKIENPNKVYALVGGFCSGNPLRFHEPSGEGYRFLADFILKLDPINPEVAARIVQPLSNWQQFQAPSQTHMCQALEQIAQARNISPHVLEIVEKSLAVARELSFDT